MYDITDFAKSHPGGAQLLALAVGRDATILFESHHVRPEIVAKTLKTLPKVDTDVNLCPDESFPKPLDSPIYRRIQQRVRDEIMAPLEKSRGRVPSGRGGCQLDAAAVLAFFAASLAWYVSDPTIASGCALGLAGYWSGTGLQHTANHGGLCLSSWWNQAWGWFGSDVVIGKSSLEWRYHHMVSHHSYCNDHERDQDVYTSFPLIRLDESQPWSWFHRFQQVYTPFGGSAVRRVADGRLRQRRHQQSLAGCGVHRDHHERGGAVRARQNHAHRLTFGLPAYLHGVQKTSSRLSRTAVRRFLRPVLVLHRVAQPGRAAAEPAVDEDQGDWGRWQIETSATWGNAFWSFLSGGLNYQIEHHMFPRHGAQPLPGDGAHHQGGVCQGGHPVQRLRRVLRAPAHHARMFSFLGKMAVNPAKAK